MKMIVSSLAATIVASLLFSCSSGPKYTMVEISNLKGGVKKEVRERKLISGERGDEFTFSQEFDEDGAALNFKNTIIIGGGHDTIEVDMTFENKEGKLYKMTAKDNNTIVTGYNEDDLWTDMQVTSEHDSRTVKIFWEGQKVTGTETSKDGKLVMKESWTFNEKGDHASHQFHAEQGGEDVTLISTETFTYDAFDDNDNWTRRSISNISNDYSGGKEIKQYVETRELTYF